MQKWLSRGLIVALVVSLFTGVLGQSIASAKSPKPQDQVKNFMTAAAGLKGTKAASYWISEESSNVSAAMKNVASGTKISLAKVKIVMVSQTADTVIINVTYNIKIKVKGKADVNKSSEQASFNLKNVNNIWLIDGSTIWNKEPWNVTATAATTVATQTSTPAATPTTTNTSEPVRIGAINPWSGPTAMSGLAFADPCIKLVEQQVKDQGGILGGRDVKVIRYDNRGSVADGQAGVKKLAEGDKVSAIVFGGVSNAEVEAVAYAADQYKMLVSINSIKPDYKGNNAVSNAPSRYAIEKVILYSAINIEKAKTVAFLASDIEDSRSRVSDMKDSFGEAGVKVVYENYASVDTMDFSSYLTKIKYAKPDYLYLDFPPSEPYITIAKQMMELGGWGDTKVGALPSAESAAKQSGANGWYLSLFWFPGSTNPGSVKFETGLKAILGRTPSASHVYFYMCLWTAIHAIESAGTDTNREAIAKAARSGNLEWETPAGLGRWGTNGFSNLPYQLARVDGGKLVQVPVTE